MTDVFSSKGVDTTPTAGKGGYIDIGQSASVVSDGTMARPHPDAKGQGGDRSVSPNMHRAKSQEISKRDKSVPKNGKKIFKLNDSDGIGSMNNDIKLKIT